jgi:hypothetical protein
MSPDNVYVANSFPKEEPFILNMVNDEGSLALLRRPYLEIPHSLDVGAVLCTCPGSF